MNITLSGWLHPRFRHIESFAYGSSDEPLGVSIRGHLESCSKCQDRVRALRALRAHVCETDIPPMSRELRSRALARAADGARIIPSLPASQPHRSSRRWPAYAAAAAVVVAAFAIPTSRELNAGASAGELTLSQTSALPAPVINVRYVASGLLDGSDRVTLRVTTYVGRKLAPELREYPLMRGSEKTFAGVVTLPAGASYAQYELVSVDGSHVDDNDARGWDSAVSDSTGRPLLDGLWVQQFVMGRTNWETALSAARAMWQHYPDEPTALRYVMAKEMQLAGSARTDSALAIWRPKVLALSAKLARTSLEPDQMWELAMAGGQASDTTIVNFWRARLTKEFPRHASTIQQRVFAIGERTAGKARLPEFDRLFDETGGQSPQLLYEGFNVAMKYGDSATIARWGDRMLAYGQGYETSVASAYASHPSFRTRGIEMLRASLARLAPVPSADWQVALRARAAQAQRPTGQWQLVELGSALLALGKIEAARDTLRRAAALGWDIGAMRSLGDAELVAGDTAGAVAAYAWISADPRTSAKRADSLRTMLGHAGTGSVWDAAIRSGQGLIDGITMRSAIHRRFDPSSSFALEEGARTTMTNAIGGAPYAIVAFISRNCGPSLSDLAALTSKTEELNRRGIPVITLVEESPSAGLTAALAQYGFAAKLAYDDRGVVSRAMRQSGTPQYFVVENGNDIRFDARRIEDVIPFLDAITRQK